MKRLKKFLYSALLTIFVILGSVSVFANPPSGVGGDAGGGSGGCKETLEASSTVYASTTNDNTVENDTNNSLDINGYFDGVSGGTSDNTNDNSGSGNVTIKYITKIVRTQEQYQECIEYKENGTII